jgi:hypothetical protein
MPRVYRDVSTVLVAVIASVVLVLFVAVPGSWIIVIGDSVRGRNRVAMMTPDETIATAIFARKKRRIKGGENDRQHA